MRPRFYKKLLIFTLLITGCFLFLSFKEAKADSFMCQCAYSSGTIEAATMDEARSRCITECDSLGGFIGIFSATAPSGTCDFCCCTDGSTNSGEGISCYESCLDHGGIQASQTYECTSPPSVPPACGASSDGSSYQECYNNCLADGTDPAICQSACSTSPGQPTDCYNDCLADGTDPAICQSACSTSPGQPVVGPRIGNVTLPNWFGVSTISGLITNIVDFLINVIALPFAVFMVILAGFRFVTAQGNEEKLRVARRNFVWTIVGVAVVLAAKILVVYIEELMGGTGNTLINFINRIKGTLNLVIAVLFSLVTVYFIWGVIQYVVSGGDEEKLRQGKRHMVWGIIGMAIMGAAWGIVGMIAAYVG